MSDQPVTQSAATVPRALGRLRIALNNSFARTSRALELTPQQAELLIYASSPKSICELARLLGADRSNVSHLVDRATARGLLARRPDDSDRRVRLVTLTDEGRALAAELIGRLESLTADLRADWSPDRTTAGAELLTEIAETLEAGSE